MHNMSSQLNRFRSQLRNNARPNERRNTTRVSGKVPLVIHSARGPQPAIMIDISLTGFRLTCRSGRRLPEIGKIHIPTMKFEARAKRIWLRGDHSGWKFIYRAEEETAINALIRQAKSTGISLS